MPSVPGIFAAWPIPPGLTLALLVTGAIYLRGWRRLRLTRPTQFPGWRLACFLGGLACLWLSLASPLDSLGGLLLSAHMVQHLVLMSVAPPLLLLGWPTAPILRGLPRSMVRDALGPFFSARWLHALGGFLTQPRFAWVAFNVVYLGWHVPAAYELALRSAAWHEAEHASFLITGLLFWWPVILPWPARARSNRWLVLPYLLSADLLNTGLSAFLCFSGRVVYPIYAAAPRVTSFSALDDQVAAGAFMWVAGSTAFLLPAVFLVVRLLSPAHRSITMAAVPGKVPSTARPFDLLRLPLIGTLLRWRYGRAALQSATLLVALAVMLHGFLGHPMGAMNLAGIVPWTYVRVFSVLALIAAGNLFCMACPFMLPREIARRLTRLAGLPRGLAWPRPLRSKWLAVALLAGFFWAYEAFSLWDSPVATAGLLAAYFSAALLVDTLFRDASFCKYVCPIGQFNFTASLVSPLELKVLDQPTCSACKTRDCIAGNAHQRGCELHLFAPRKSGSLDCTLCLDCVHACPSDNLGILAAPPARGLLADPVQSASSIGHLSRRLDVAALALVVVTAAFANAAAMVGPVADALARASAAIPSHALSLAAGAALALLCPALVALAVLAAASSVRRAAAASLRSAFCRLALALIPLGMGMWLAHLGFHLVTGWTTLVPGIRQALFDLAPHRFAEPDWSSAAPLFAPETLLALQLLALDAGLLFSLYLGWRIAGEFVSTGKAGRAAVFLPWAAVAVALYAAGFWILLQPMQMRGMVM